MLGYLQIKMIQILGRIWVVTPRYISNHTVNIKKKAFGIYIKISFSVQ
jgi:hypothetical protein